MVTWSLVDIHTYIHRRLAMQSHWCGGARLIRFGVGGEYNNLAQHTLPQEGHQLWPCALRGAVCYRAIGTWSIVTLSWLIT